MKVVTDTELVRRPVQAHGSKGAAAAHLARAAQAAVTRIELAPGGRLGRHPAATDQLFVVIEGEASVTGGDGVAAGISAGSAVLWAAGEAHETTTELGVTALVVEAPGLDVSD